MTKLEFVDAMTGMFHSKGWAIWERRLRELREDAVAAMLQEGDIGHVGFLAMQHRVQDLDTLLSIREEVAQHRATIRTSPESAGEEVETPAEVVVE
jgi:hypothetical protein